MGASRYAEKFETERGFTLVEVLAALALVVCGAALAVAAGQAMLRFAQEARAEEAGLIAGQAKVEEILSLLPAYRAEGHDTVDVAGVAITRIWRVRPVPELPGLDRIEVSARWDVPGLRILVLVAVAP